MPQIQLPVSVAPCSQNFTLLLWRMTESEEELLQCFPVLKSLASEYETYRSLSRRLEYLSVRALLCSSLGYVPIVGHTSEGRPFLDDGRRISISHTKGFCTVIISEIYNVAVDIEYRSDRVLRIASRFLRPEEAFSSLDDKLIAWCAKETLYKLHSADHLVFADMCIRKLTRGQETHGCLVVENLKRGISTEVNYMSAKDYILTYAVEKNI